MGHCVLSHEVSKHVRHGVFLTANVEGKERGGGELGGMDYWFLGPAVGDISEHDNGCDSNINMVYPVPDIIIVTEFSTLRFVHVTVHPAAGAARGGEPRSI